MHWLLIIPMIPVLAIGIWIGLGAPGWPHKPEGGDVRRRREKRPINPVSWANTRRRTRRH